MSQRSRDLNLVYGIPGPSGPAAPKKSLADLRAQLQERHRAAAKQHEADSPSFSLNSEDERGGKGSLQGKPVSSIGLVRIEFFLLYVMG